ncbi:hypothetical protein BJ508DRAFT_302823 [Ascobolus immersus RN42]|uniref:F-box domain-containing protein n=1 Tax=Ascobolus immersus RN42 TaxID=1160509 RepID=A0A3N4IIV2_ASCIM|nr:hypothetical protein BJ508DRAFT_302823 [Ascobolus immersus RN42]
MSTLPPLMRLPNEILYEIAILSLDLQDFLALQSVNRRFSVIVATEYSRRCFADQWLNTSPGPRAANPSREPSSASLAHSMTLQLQTFLRESINKRRAEWASFLDRLGEGPVQMKLVYGEGSWIMENVIPLGRSWARRWHGTVIRQVDSLNLENVYLAQQLLNYIIIERYAVDLFNGTKRIWLQGEMDYLIYHVELIAIKKSGERELPTALRT